MSASDDLPQLRRHAPADLPIRVVQFGQGNFLRGFLGWMLQVYNDRCHGEFGVVVVRPTSRSTASLLDTQDGLYTTVLRGLDSEGHLQTRVNLVNCVQRELDLARHYGDFLALARNPDVRFFVSNTTEAGIVVNCSDRLEDAPASTFPAKLTRWLIERYRHFAADPAMGVALLPCELIESNGTQLRAAVQHFADLWGLEPGFTTWLDQACAFCCTLVDRIVTGFPTEEIDVLQVELGYRDNFLVAGELYHLWAIQGPEWVAREFPLHLADLHVLWVDDLTPLRERKVAILNGSHTLLAAVGTLLGVRTVREALEDADLSNYLVRTLHREVLPGLLMPIEELHAYTDDVLRRFRNPWLHHALSAISLNMESKCLTRLWPALNSFYQQHGCFPAGLVLGMAAVRLSLQSDRISTALLDVRIAQLPGLNLALDDATQRIGALGPRAAINAMDCNA